MEKKLLQERMKTLIVRDVEKVMSKRNVQPSKRPAQFVVR